MVIRYSHKTTKAERKSRTRINDRKRQKAKHKALRKNELEVLARSKQKEIRRAVAYLVAVKFEPYRVELK